MASALHARALLLQSVLLLQGPGPRPHLQTGRGLLPLGHGLPAVGTHGPRVWLEEGKRPAWAPGSHGVRWSQEAGSPVRAAASPALSHAEWGARVQADRPCLSVSQSAPGDGPSTACPGCSLGASAPPRAQKQRRDVLSSSPLHARPGVSGSDLPRSVDALEAPGASLSRWSAQQPRCERLPARPQAGSLDVLCARMPPSLLSPSRGPGVIVRESSACGRVPGASHVLLRLEVCPTWAPDSPQTCAPVLWPALLMSSS